MKPSFATRSACALLLAGLAGNALATGCIVVRPTSPLSFNFDNEHEPQDKPGPWEYSLGYRWFLSDRHFRGTHEEPERQREGTDVRNRSHTLDHSLTYHHGDRWRFTASLPMQYSTRTSLYEHDRINRYKMRAGGIGDLRLIANREMLAKRDDLQRGLALGIGIKLPTGKDDVTDTAFTVNGPEERSVDQSIQPGDGGTGLILEMQAYREIFDKKTIAFFSGSYLINPRETNGVRTFRSRPNEAIMSVPDTYQARTGLTRLLSETRNLTGDLAFRIEGVPARDLVGGSDGFRRPGYAVYIEPGINVQTRTGHRFGLSIPVAIQRNRIKSVTDRENGVHGDAAFADYLVLANYGYRW